MFNLGFTEMIAIGIIALIFIGPKQLPDLAKVLGRMMKEFKKATEDLSGGLLEASREVKRSVEEAKTEILSTTNELTEEVSKLKKNENMQLDLLADLDQKNKKEE